MQTSEPCFYNYFSQYQADVVRYHLRKDLREASGLGSPPAQFTTNGSESINAALKRKVNHKESECPQFNENLKAYVQSHNMKKSFELYQVMDSIISTRNCTLCHLSVSVVTTQSTMPVSLGSQSGSAIPGTCAAVNISTSPLRFQFT